MRGNFEKCLAETLRHEGGWSDHPDDPGGATMKGVTLGTFRQYRPGATKADLRAISDADLRRIYREGYWDKVRGDDLPAGLDMIAFDAAVNSGPSRGARWLQSPLGVAADGRIGPATITAANRKAAAGRAATLAIIDAALETRVSFLRGLNTWPTFGKGWMNRVNAVQVAAYAMVRDPQPAAGSGWLANLITSIINLFARK